MTGCFSRWAHWTFSDYAQLGTTISYVSVFQTLRDEGLAAVVSLLRKEISRQGATLLVFDGLLNARDRADTQLDVKTFVAEVQSQAAFVGCTVLFLASTRVSEDSPEHTMVDGVLELHDESAGVRTVRRLQVKKSRGSRAMGGYHQFEISSAGFEVFPRLEIALERPSIPDHVHETRLSSSVSGLDALVGGGLPTGSVTLLFGPSGSGKTSLGLSFLNNASQSEPALHFGFYETPARIRSKADALGLDLASHMETGSLEIMWNPMTENLLDKLGHRLLDAVKRRGVKRLLIDGLGGFGRAAISPSRLVEFFAALTNELRALGVTTIATWELRDLFGPTVSAPGSEVSSLLDNLMMLRQVEMGSQYIRTLSILKIRDSVFDPMIREVEIGNNGLSIGVPISSVTGAATGIATPAAPGSK